jgi:hypothetical protein
MTRLVVLLLALLAAAGARAACEPGGMGGTGIRGDGGIGGTGIRAEGDVGIIGVITGFGSICVNGIEVEYDATTPVSSDGAPAPASALALGKLVAVRAVASGAQARAREIRILDALVGRAEAVDAAAGELRVDNQRVRLAASTVLEPNVSLAQLAGRSVRVSGLWRADGSLAATRIERAPADAAPRVGARDWPDLGAPQLIVEGYVADVRPNAVRVGGLSFDADARVTQAIERDRRVRVFGRVERDGRPHIERFDVERVERERPERGEREGRDGRGEGRGGHVERPERGDNRGPGRPDRPERIERPDRGGGLERPERIERLDRSGPH